MNYPLENQWLEPEDPHQEQKEHLPQSIMLEVFVLGGVSLQQDPLAVTSKMGFWPTPSM